MRGADQKTTDRARSLRRSQTEAEERFWSVVRARRLNGYKFVRQCPIDCYFADFACRERHLIVELDGSQHADSLYDAQRDNVLNRHGWNVLRFWNADVFIEADALIETVLAALEGRMGAAFQTAEMKWKPALIAPHPPFGHLLPAGGEKASQGQ
ncbi:MAG: DUF559 domain-containing protein [Phyllobacteriaceae bacterium]|nr:DUF559 domain-containing protein [Phyllobacteriaceae bacterium]